MAPATTSGFFSRILSNPRLLWPGYVVMMCLLAAVCFGSLKDHGLNMHDRETFHDNEVISEDFSYFFSLEKRHPSGRPFAELVKFLAYLVWGNDPRFYHLLVVAVHCLAAILLAPLAWGMGTSLATGLVSGLLFLLNVSHFEAIHHISALDYPLALGCGMGAMLSYLRYLSTPRACWLVGLYAGLIVGLMAHMSVVVVLPFCFYWSWVRGYDPKIILRLLLPLAGLIAIELAFLFFITSKNTSTWVAVGVLSEGDPVGLPVTMVRILLLLLSRLPTTAHWLPMPFYKWHSWDLFAGAAVLAGLALLVWWKRSPASVWSLWVLLSMLPFVLINDPILFERPWTFSRYLYMATAGTSVLLAWGLELMAGRFGPGRPYVHAAVLTGICISSYYYLKQSEAISLYSSGRNYIVRGDTKTGVEQFKRAIDQGRDAIDLLDTYKRMCYVGMGVKGMETTLDEALAAFPTSLQLTTYKLAFDSLKPDSVLSRGAREKLEALKTRESQASIAVGSGGRVVLTGQDIIATVRREIAGFYHNAGGNLGADLVPGEDLDVAILAYQRALEFDPDRLATYENLVSSLAAAGRGSEAVVAALEAVEWNPDAPTGLQVTASFGLVTSGRLEEAVALCHRALQDESATEVQRRTVYQIYRGVLKGTHGGISSASATRMGMDLLDGGRAEEADWAFRQALDKDAANRRAHFGLGLALLSQGQVEEAGRLYAEGVSRFGRTAATEAGAVEGVQSLIARGIQVEAAREILATHWPEL